MTNELINIKQPKKPDFADVAIYLTDSNGNEVLFDDIQLICQIETLASRAKLAVDTHHKNLPRYGGADDFEIAREEFKFFDELFYMVNLIFRGAALVEYYLDTHEQSGELEGSAHD